MGSRRRDTVEGTAMTRPTRTRPTRSPRARSRTLPQLLQAAVEADPSAVAARFADAAATLGELTYAELDERSTRLARSLIGRGVGPEDLVALGVPRSLESLTALWAVVKTGAGFVPIDPNYPADRIAHMVTDSGARVGLTVAAVADALPATVDWLVLDDPRAFAAIAEESAEPITYAERVRPLRADHPAYVIYTSGSTGLPKGVVVRQAGLANLCDEMRDRFQVRAESRTLHVASPSFDASVLELLLAVGAAATMVVVAPTVFGGAELAELLRREQVTHAFITPAALASVDPAGLPDFTMVAVGGEACPPELIRRWALPLPDGTRRRFHDAYGPTETTVLSNIGPALEPGDIPDIGGPIRGLTEYVLDDRLARVPTGVVGELYITGPGLARGYHDRAGLTASRFVADPFDPDGARMYRTGDLVRHTPAGGLEYLGRNDFQVKIRGFRIELGEIDAVLAAHESVDFAVTVGHELESGATILVAYVHPAPGAAVDVDELGEVAARRLPAHMVPTTIMVLDEIPLTPVGKLDRRALPEPVLRVKEFRAPSGRFETVVAGVFADLLNREDPIGADDDFFALGGNSLLATRAAARLGAALDTQISPRTLFEHATVAALARALAETAGSGRRPALTRRPRPELIPLSPAQQRMWFLSRFDPESAANNIPFAVRLSGGLDVTALHAAVADLLERHETLRTVYPAVDGVGYQQVLPTERVLPDLSPRSMGEDELRPWLLGSVLAGFDVSAEVPLRMGLAWLGAQDYVLSVVVHHIAADGASIAPMVRDLMTAYTARTAGHAPDFAPLPVHYADYTLWQRELLGDESDPTSLAATQLDYWRKELAGLPERLELPTDRPRPAVASGRGGVQPFEIPAGLAAALRELAADHGTSLFMVLHAGLAVLLARLAATEDVAIGTPVAGRGERELDDLIGMFVNTLVLRTPVHPDGTFADLLARVKDTDLRAFSNAEVPFERLVEVLDPVRSQAHHPLIQVALFFQNLDSATLELPDLSIEVVEFDGAVAKFDLQITVQPDGDVASAAPVPAMITYAADLFDQAGAAEFAERLVRVLTAVAADPERPVGSIELLAPLERDRILLDWNDTGHPIAPELLLDGYRQTVADHPDAVAVVYEGAELTYREFDARVNRVARLLIARGVGAESLVGLAMRRSADLVVGMYAILTAGGAYVPLDPDHPAERIGHILDTARPVCVLSTSADAAALPSGVEVLALDRLDLDGTDSAPVRPDELVRPLHRDHPAYVIFTSGSTGRPKGVAISHAAIHNQITWMLAQYPLGPADVYLQKTATTFDVSLWGYFMPLRAGARLVVATPDGHRDPGYVADTIAAAGVTVTDFVPSMLTVFAAHAPAAALGTLRHVFAIGEALPPETVAAFAAVSDAALHNLYGPTEAAVSVTYQPADRAASGSVPIGLPQWNTQVYVLDSRLRPVPAGVVGELYLAGDQLARGYVRRPDLTADRFVANPFGFGARVYRTGDLVAWRRDRDGQLVLDYLGRTDFQVKFRGQRIELGEIETALLAVEGVSQAVVVVLSGPTGDQLVGYAVPAPGHDPDPVALRDELAKTLPPYMVPAVIVPLDAFPLNSSGKLDRKALRAPVFEARAFAAPATALEEAVAQVFADVLGVERIGRDDDFFELGGNSLSATRVAARLGDALDTRVPVRLLFEVSTVAGLAARVELTDRDRKALVAGPRPDRIPLSPAQQRMWFLNQFDTGAAAYNLPVAVQLSGALDIPALRAAALDIITRHETLRTRYPQTDDGPIQEILPPAAPDLGLVEVSEEALFERVAEIASTGFDVAAEVPLRLALFRIGGAADEHVLLLVVHHIAADGWSLGALTRDIMAAYAARSQGEAPNWAPLPVQYADYALWQRESLGDAADPESPAAAQLAYWTDTLAGLPEESTLPMDRPRPEVQSYRGGAVSFRVDAETHRGLRELARAANATVFMVVHSALAVLLARMAGTDDVAIGTPVAGRGAAELDDVIGMFVNTVVLRTILDPSEPYTDLLARTREDDLAAFAHADIPFEQLVEVLAPARSTGRTPLFQVALSFVNLPSGDFELPGLSIRGLDAPVDIERFDMQLTVVEGTAGGADGMAGELTYARDIFDAATVRAFAERFVRILHRIVAGPSTPVGDLRLLSEAEADRLVRMRGRVVTATGTLPDLLDAAARGNPDGVALEDGERSLTYRELDALSARWARALIARGVGPGDLVAIGIPRSLESVLAFWSVARAGAGFVPVDPNYPAERVAHMLADSGAAFGLTLTALRSDFGDDLEWLALDAPGFDLDEFAATPVTDADRVRPVRTVDVAYVVYTSGSTGVPKGVAVTHAGLAGYNAEQRERFTVTPESRTLHFATPSFDGAVLELLLAIGGGATMVVVPTDVYGGADLTELLRARRVTHMFITAAALASLDPTGLTDLRAVFTGGETWSPDLVRRWAVDGRRFHNAYGPTETTIIVNFSEPLTPGEPVTIGAPIRGITEWVLDERLNPVPPGVAGELYIAGDQLAAGYHRRPGLTAGRFVACPWHPAQRMYRTGDVVRWTHRGEIEFVGRNDFQVKVRGFRIELGEVDAVLADHPSVEFAVTVGRKTGTGATVLVSYVKPVADERVDIGALAAYAQQRLPAHMVPTSIMALDEIPLTPVGKLDRKALPEPLFETAIFRAPADAVEQAVADVYAEVLGVEQVGVDDDFFALGGNSLSATRVTARLGALLRTKVPVRLLFEAPTVEALAARLDAPTGPEVPALVAGPRPERVPLSPAQQRMWFLNQFDTAAPTYNIPAVVRLTGVLDVEAFGQAIADVVSRHEVLRTTYPQTADGPEQVVRSAADAIAPVHPIVVRDTEVPSRITEIIGTGFDVATEVPLRVALLRVNAALDEHVVVFVVHHIAGDGWSMGPLTRDVMAAYAARAAGVEPGWTPLPVQYADYALWQRELLGAEDDPESTAARQIEFWRAELSGLPAESTLPGDRARTPMPTRRGASLEFGVDGKVRAALAEVARTGNATLFMVVHSALAVLLARLSGAEDLAIGTPVAGRGAAELDDLIGMFVNTVVLRSHVDPRESFTDLLARQRETDLAALAQADIPFERLVDVLEPERSTARSPLFQVSLAFQNLPSGSFELPGLRVGAVDFDAATEKFDLSLTIRETVDPDGANTLSCHLSYATDLYDPQTAAGFAERFQRLLAALAADPSQAVGDVELLTEAEREQVLRTWSASGPDVGLDATLVELFDGAVRDNAERTAVVFDERKLTYAELDARVNRLARTLIRAGAGPETLVAVALPRSLDLVVALLATVKAGAGYLPVDPTYPADRIAYMLDDAQPVCVLSTAERDVDLPADLPVLEIDTLDLSQVPAGPITAAERRAPLTPDSIAYVIYTSGSTGRPKGVRVPHRTVVALFANTHNDFGFDRSDVWTMFHSYAFDFSVWELWGPLLYGGTLVVVDYYVSRSPEQFLHLLRRERVTVLNQTPSAFYQLAEADRVAEPTAPPLALRYIVFGGEALEPRRLADWYSRHTDTTPRLVNMYGITETTVHVTRRALDAASVEAADASVVGRAIAGLRTYLLDSGLRPVPPGVPGEIYVAGSQLARGYLGRRALTASRFVANPFDEPGALLYRSGDLARWNRDGDLEYLGRADDQVKVRGFRIELGEIEAALLAQERVRQVAVVVREDKPGDQRIVAYLVGDPGAALDVESVREGAGEALPTYMVPSAFVVLDAIPLTANGKLDRRALPAPTFTTTATREPIGDVEARIAELFAQVLGLESVGVDDSFFAVGGDSILSIQLVSRAKAAGIVFSPRQVFEQRTVAGLARVAAAAADSTPDVLEELRGGGVGEIPLTPVLAAYLAHGSHNRFFQSMVLGLPEEIDAAGLVETIGAVLDHHDVLRSRVFRAETGWRLEALPTGAIDPTELIGRIDIPAGTSEEELRRIAASAVEETVDALDPAAARMLAFTWLSRPDGPDVLAVAAHHYAIDGVSWRVLIPDLATAWAQRLSGQPIALSPNGTSFRRWAHGLVEVAPRRRGEIDFWRSVVATPDPLLGARALDPAFDTQATVRRVQIRVPVEVAEAVLTTVPALYRGGVNDGLLAALAMAVRAWRARRGVDAPRTLVKLEGHGREEEVLPGADLTRTVGWFTSIYPVALDLSGVDPATVFDGGAATGDAIKAIKEQLLAVPDKGIGYGLLRHLDPESGARVAGPLGQISFNYLGRVSAGGVPEGLTALGWMPTDAVGQHSPDQDHAMPAAAVVDVNAIVNDGPDGPLMDVTFLYAAEVIGESEVRELAEDWVDALGALARHTEDPSVGGLTPSDVPLVRVTQDEIERWRAQRPGLSDILPLSPLQAGLLFLTELDLDAVDDYVMQFSLELAGGIYIDRMRRAAQALLDRHASLRTAFVNAADGTPVALVVDAVPVPWQAVPDVPDEQLDAVLAAEQRRRFDPATAPLMRVSMHRTVSGRSFLTLTTHHILLDGWSMPLLMKDLLALYALRGDGTALPRVRPYREYLAWLSEQDPDASRRAWTDALAGVEPTPLVPALPAPATPADGVGVVELTLSPEETAELTAMASGAGVTVNTVVQAAWALVVAASTDRSEAVFGAAVSGRPPQLDGIDSMVGLFVNTIPVRVRFEPDWTVRELLGRLQSEQAALLDHHYLGLADLQRAVGVDALFDTMIAFESYPVDSEGLAEAGTIDGMSVVDLRAVNYTHYPVTLLVNLDTRLWVKVQHHRASVDDAVARSLTDRLRMLLGAFVTAPERALSRLSLLLEPERFVLESMNGTDVAWPADEATLVSKFRIQSERSPDAPALSAGGRTLTYAELRERVDVMADALAARGAGPDTLVAVAMRRSIDLVVAVHAVLSCGAAYVPVDPDHPAERNDHVLGSARPLFVLTTAADDFVTGTEVPVVDVADLDEPEVAPARRWPRPDNLAYVIYTSGSTGRPKGVMITHRQMVNQFRWAQSAYPHNRSDTVLHKTPITFDISTWELFWPLQTGARLVLAEPDGHRDPRYLAELIRRESVSTVHFVPSMLDAFLDLAPDLPTAVPRRVFAAGEALGAGTVARFDASLPGALHNWYGPAEATVVTACRANGADPNAPVSIGSPVANTRVYVLDRQLRQVPLGAPGELYVGGVQLARGYVGAPALTAERFVADPFRPGVRLYRTGDVVRLSRGGLEYLGRADFQVKIRGQRIELGEIEAVLARHDAVAHAAAAVVPEPDRLVAYVVAAPDREIDDAALLEHARASLPGYMVPAVVVTLPELPLNASGKLDRRALPVPEFTARAYRAPVTPTQHLVAEVFAEILGLDRVGLDDDFFALGGTSLEASRVAGRLRARSGAEVRVQWFFLAPTVEALGDRLAEAAAGTLDYTAETEAAMGVLLPIRASGDRPALFCVHPMYGLAWCYSGLVRHVGRDTPIYGIQAAALSEDAPPPRSLREMAHRYATEIVAAQPRGPYHLLGWSLGGVLAHEIAVILQTSGREVAVLAMLDSDHDFDLTTWRTATVELLAELGLTGVDAAGFATDRPLELSEADFAKLYAAIPADTVGITPDRLRRIYTSAMRSVELTREFEPKFFDGTVQFFRAAADTRRTHDVIAAWHPYAARVVDHPVAATHEVMTQAPALGEIGPVLDRLLRGEDDAR
ncbi:non-ribosomal peptide synthase/polyketide synthase [Nocardia takedensis]|uniref:non-ribosomal peptide synthase/polyketide synthase n=1 Tax=Nocardia takedensis TaxID=259390 RepID=UPI00402BA66F